MKLSFIESNFDLIEDYLLKVLPHGSGIDCKWQFDYQKNGKIRAVNAFHCMDENGYYCGYADFTLTVDLDSPQDFRLVFNGADSHRLNSKYMLKGYLEETFHYALVESNPSFDAVFVNESEN